MDTNRDAYRKKIEAQLDIWEARLEELKATADRVGTAAKDQVRRQVQEMRTLQEPAREFVAKFRDTSAWAWHDVRSELEGTWMKLSTAIEAAWKRLTAPSPPPGEARPG